MNTLSINRRVISYVTLAAVAVSAFMITLSYISSKEDTSSTGLPDDSTAEQTENVTEPKPAILITGMTIGAPSAMITIVEYTDFQ